MADPSPTPAEDAFPVAWERPGDERLLWRRDLEHAWRPVSTLGREVPTHEGFLLAAERLGGSRPTRGMCVNGHHHEADLPGAPAPEELEARRREPMARARAALRTDWDGVYLPEIRAYVSAQNRTAAASCGRCGVNVRGRADRWLNGPCRRPVRTTCSRWSESGRRSATSSGCTTWSTPGGP